MKVLRNGAERAFTLLEVLIAMSMFTVVGFAVVLLMKAGVDMWIGGNTISQQEDRLEQSLPRLADDARMVSVPALADLIPFDPENPDPREEPAPLPAINRMVSGVHKYKIGERTVPSRYWAFVREIGPTELDAYVRRAGTSAEADAYIDGKNDEQEFKEKKHMATGGLMEVLWIYLPDEDRPGIGSLCRSFRSPIGGKDTLLDPKNHADLQLVRTKIKPEPILSNILYFDIWFWTEFTTTWEWTPSEPSVVRRPIAGQDGRVRLFSSGPSYTWDSTRAAASLKMPETEFIPPANNSASMPVGVPAPPAHPQKRGCRLPVGYGRTISSKSRRADSTPAPFVGAPSRKRFSTASGICCQTGRSRTCSWTPNI